jgi:hypothetical protein
MMRGDENRRRGREEEEEADEQKNLECGEHEVSVIGR